MSKGSELLSDFISASNNAKNRYGAAVAIDIDLSPTPEYPTPEANLQRQAEFLGISGN